MKKLSRTGRDGTEDENSWLLREIEKRIKIKNTFKILNAYILNTLYNSLQDKFNKVYRTKTFVFITSKTTKYV